MNQQEAFEAYKLKMDVLTAGRPRAYRWLLYQRILAWTFLLVGIVLLATGINIIMMTALKETALLYCKENINDIIGFYIPPEFVDHILTYFLPVLRNIQITLGISVIGLSLLCLVIARYCQKIIKRNKYIMRVEDAWNELKQQLATLH